VALLAMGDALAMAVQHRRGFSPEQFAWLHPAALWAAAAPVRDVMRTGSRNPTVRWDASLRETAAVMTRTEGRPGAASVVDAQGKLVGIFTDGDLRRLVQSGEVDFARPVSAVMERARAQWAPIAWRPRQPRCCATRRWTSCPWWTERGAR